MCSRLLATGLERTQPLALSCVLGAQPAVLCPQLGDGRVQGATLSTESGRPPLQGVDREKVHTVDVGRGNRRIALAEAEGGVEILRGGTQVSDGRVLGFLAPLLDRHACDPRKDRLAVDHAEVRLAVANAVLHA